MGPDLRITPPRPLPALILAAVALAAPGRALAGAIRLLSADDAGLTVSVEVQGERLGASSVPGRAHLEVLGFAMMALPGRPELIDNPHHSAAQRAHRDRAAEGTRAFPDRPIPVGLTLLCQLSNTTRLVSRTAGEYVTLRKSGGRLRPFDCELFLNVNNKFDPVSRVCAYRMPDRPGAFDVVLEHIHQPNVHGFGHYLSHPAVHGPIFRALVAEFSFACEQRARTLADSPEWRGIGGALGAAAKAKQDEVEAKLRSLLRDGGDVSRLRAVIVAMIENLGVKL